MKELRNRMLRRLFHDARRLSRNKHFHTYLDPSVRYAALIARILRGLRHDLLSRPLTSVVVERVEGGDQPWFRLQMSWPQMVRTSFLTEQELQVLREDARVDEVLRRAERKDPEQPPTP